MNTVVVSIIRLNTAQKESLGIDPKTNLIVDRPDPRIAARIESIIQKSQGNSNEALGRILEISLSHLATESEVFTKSQDGKIMKTEVVMTHVFIIPIDESQVACTSK